MRMLGNGLEVPSYMNVNVPERQTFSESAGGSKRRCTGDAGNGNAAFENLNDDGRQRLEVPSNTNVNIPERRTFAEDVGGSKRRCVRQLDIAGPSQPM
ncbi:hypothetical protein Tco_0602472, partial [Tanacetum coccineum]